MKIGIDASTWHNNRGFGRFTRELVAEMLKYSDRHQFVIFTDDLRSENVNSENIEWCHVLTGRKVVEAAVVDDRRSIRDVLAFRKCVSKYDLDVLFYPAVYSWFPPPRNVRSIVTLHDAIAEHFPELVFPHAKGRTMWTIKTWLAKKMASHILTVSNTAKAEIIEYINIKPSKITVICEGANAEFLPVTDAVRRERVLSDLAISPSDAILTYVGGFAPHKNLLRMISAFQTASEDLQHSNLKLVLVGDPGGGGFHSEYDKMLKQINASPTLRNNVILPGYMSDEDLAALLTQATAMIMPSLSEGFGLPALEAMNCGLPVLATANGAVMEVAGKSGLAFDPLSVPSITDAIKRIVTDEQLREDLRAATAPEATRNTWDRAAMLTIQAIEALG